MALATAPAGAPAGQGEYFLGDWLLASFQPSLEDLYRQQQSRRRQRTDALAAKALLLLHVAALFKPVTPIVFVVRASRLFFLGTFYLFVRTQPEAYALARTPIILSLNAAVCVTMLILRFCVARDPSIYIAVRKDFSLPDDDAPVSTARELLAPTGLVALFMLCHNFPLDLLQLQMASQAMVVALNVAGLLLVQFSEAVREEHQGSMRLLAGVHASLQRALPWGRACEQGPAAWRRSCQWAGGLAESELELASCQLQVFLSLSVGFVAPIYIRAMLELHDRLCWARGKRLVQRAPVGLAGRVRAWLARALLRQQGCSLWVCVLAHVLLCCGLTLACWHLSEVFTVALASWM